MRYLSTRNKNIRVMPSAAILRGLSNDGGLFVPEFIPRMSLRAIGSLCSMTYRQRAVYIMSSFLDEFSAAELTNFAAAAYGENFDSPEIAPLRKLDDGTYFMELWHGPTSAFKDMALQMLPHLLTASMAKQNESKDVVILTATSGDTGKAAMEGFQGVDRTRIMVFYPQGGVSEIQELQMTTQSGENVGVCAVKGNFDDAQSGVKEIFSNAALREELARKGFFLSSANSINWGRLLAQIVYYFSAYCDLVQSNVISMGDRLHFSVPTGNFGNILAGYYARCMGLPIGKLLCASNQNNVLTDFMKTGTYDRRRRFHNTLSPSMDILISSNLERLLYDMSGMNDSETRVYMELLANSGEYTVSARLKQRLDESFWAGYCSDQKTKRVIAGTFKYYKYLIDPHTAVAYDVLNHYRADTKDETPAVVVSTASPYKFCGSVLEALGAQGAPGLAQLDRLAGLTGTKPPVPLWALKDKKRRFSGVIEKKDMENVVRGFCVR